MLKDNIRPSKEDWGFVSLEGRSKKDCSSGTVAFVVEIEALQYYSSESRNVTISTSVIEIDEPR